MVPLIVTKADVDNGNTRWAQGGVAVVLPGEHELHGSGVVALTLCAAFFVASRP